MESFPHNHHISTDHTMSIKTGIVSIIFLSCYNESVKTIKDIANELGIAPSTVSRVINNSGYYSKEVGERVRKYIEDSGIILNQSAKRLRSKKSNTIGLIIPDISNEFFSNIALIVDTFFSKQGYSIIICNTGSDSERELSAFNQLLANQVDGIICDAGGLSLDKSFLNYNTPVVAVDRTFNKLIPAARIYSNEFELGRQACQILISKGCRKPKCVYRTYPFYQSDIRNAKDQFNRFQGFTEEAKASLSDWNADEAFIEIPYFRGMAVEETERVIYSLVNNGLPFDGLFCMSDNVAYGAIKALNKANISIPEQVKVIGFDNNIYSSLSIPSITTFDRNVDMIASTACTKLMERIESDNKFIDEEIIINGSLIERQSC